MRRLFPILLVAALAPAIARGAVFQPVATGGMGDITNNKIWYPMIRYNGYLYLGSGWFNAAQEGCEIWRSGDGGATWGQVAQTGIVGNSKNRFVIDFEIFGGDLYLAAVNNVDGGGVWRSSDGLTWTQVNTPGFGDSTNIGVTQLQEFQGYLYAGTWNIDEGSELWRSPDGNAWEIVADDGYGFGFETRDTTILTVRGDTMLVATENFEFGGQLYATTDGLTFTQVNPNGFDGNDNVNVFGLAYFHGDLYASTWNATGGEVWRRPWGGSVWTRVVNNGFGDAFNSLFTLAAFDDQLWVGGSEIFFGAPIRRSADGVLFTPVDTPGLGNFRNEWVAQFNVLDDRLWVGMQNQNHGAELHRTIATGLIDGDGDGWFGEDDDCPTTFDPGQDDADGDLFGDACDCDPLDPAVNPDAAEDCNGIDDNCDGAVDEGYDGDSAGGTGCGGDCDYGNPAVNPGE
ncbi:MAG: putative metal-binding motif-containing protein, partial [Myxococcales bacterium]|nr:putative metal-binding motif-containing protein [Myxococcales bacterium]